jgi:hypothetical protein
MVRCAGVRPSERGVDNPPMNAQHELLAWRPPPPGDPVPPFKSPVILTLAPPVPLPNLSPPARTPHRLGDSLVSPPARPVSVLAR